MSLGTIQITGQRLSAIEIEDICKSLLSNNIKCLSLRECIINDKLYSKLINALSCCKSLLQLNFNLGLVKNLDRANLLCHALYKNRSLTSLFFCNFQSLHGSGIGENGMQGLCRVLAIHPNIVALDIGDCKINNVSLTYLTELLPPNGAKRGLQELTLSGNSAITPNGWVKFFIALAASNTLRKLYLDYNNLGELGISCLSVALASSKSLEVLDLEGSGVNEAGAQMLLHLVKNYPVTLTDLILSENQVKHTTVDQIQLCLQENEQKRRMSTVNSTIVANVMENDYDTTTVSELASTTASSLTLNSEVISNASDTYASLRSDVIHQSVDVEDDSDDESEYAVVSNDIVKAKINSISNHRNDSELDVNAHKGRVTNVDVNKSKTFSLNSTNKTEIVSDSDDDEDDLGTLLIGQTLPGYYSNPVRIGVNARSVGHYDRIHNQDAARIVYADGIS